MSKALSPRSATRSVDPVPVHVPLLPVFPVFPVFPEHPAATGPDRPDGDVCFHPAGLLQRVFTAAGELETAEWALDQVLEAAASGEALGIGLDVAPLDRAGIRPRRTVSRSTAGHAPAVTNG